jgi:hypothetical protein
MEPRDVFDVALVVLIALVAYWEVFGFGLSRERVDAIVATVLGLDLTVYLVVAGLFGVVFVGYITIYLPQKYGRRAPDRDR